MIQKNKQSPFLKFRVFVDSMLGTVLYPVVASSVGNVLFGG
jgi:hypothetical protein